MNTVSVIYKLEWRHKIMSWYALSKCKKLINCRTGKILKKTVNSGVIGWWIGNEFYSHNKINKTFEKCKIQK